MKKNLFYFIFIFCTAITNILAQNRVIGNVHSDKTDENLFGVKVILASPDEKTYYDQTFTDMTGNFTLKSRENNAKIILKMNGFKIAYKFVETTNKTTDVGIIYMEEEIVKQVANASALVDLATIRKSPIAAVSLLENKQFNVNSNKDFIERTSNIAGVYTTTMGGGYSDAQMRLRGYDQTNITPIVDGVALNDPQTGFINWNFIAPISDALESVQLQKGLGASKLVNASVAGTINFQLKDPFTDNENHFTISTANNDMRKYAANFSLGSKTKGFGLNLALSNTRGEGYMNGTQFDATGYYLTMGYLNAKNRFVVKLIGAPQWHNMNNRFMNLLYLVDKEGEIDAYYNKNIGMYKGNQLNMFVQTSHIPMTTLEWEFKPNKNNVISLKGYSQYGFSSQTDLVGENIYTYFSPFQKSDKSIDFDYIYGYNVGELKNYFERNNGSLGSYFRKKTLTESGDKLFLNGGTFTGSASGISMIENYRKTKVLGGLLNYQVTPFSFMKVNVGLDYRNSNFNNKRFVNNLFGGDGYLFNSRVDLKKYTVDTFVAKDNIYNVFNSPKANSVDFDNEESVVYGGLYSQIEFNFKKVNFLLQGGFNKNTFSKSTNNLFDTSIEAVKSDDIKLEGYNAKLGVNWNMSQNHNIWANGGIVSRVPIYNFVFETYSVLPSERFKNEEFKAIEFGYSFLNKNVNINLNAFANTLKDATVPYIDSNYGAWAVTEGINKSSIGLELDAFFKVTKFFSVFTANSLGRWKYTSDAKFTDLQNQDLNDPRKQTTLYVNDVIVGGTPQLMNSLGFDLSLFKNFSIRLNGKYFDYLHSNTAVEQFDPIWYEFSYAKNELKLPSYFTLDTSLKYEIKLEKNQSVALGFDMNNLGDYRYITESNTSFGNDQLNPQTNNAYSQDYPNGFRGLNGANSAFFGYGRTWNFAVRYKF